LASVVLGVSAAVSVWLIVKCSSGRIPFPLV